MGQPRVIDLLKGTTMTIASTAAVASDAFTLPIGSGTEFSVQARAKDISGGTIDVAIQPQVSYLESGTDDFVTPQSGLTAVQCVSSGVYVCDSAPVPVGVRMRLLSTGGATNSGDTYLDVLKVCYVK